MCKTGGRRQVCPGAASPSVQRPYCCPVGLLACILAAHELGEISELLKHEEAYNSIHSHMIKVRNAHSSSGHPLRLSRLLIPGVGSLACHGTSCHNHRNVCMHLLLGYDIASTDSCWSQESPKATKPTPCDVKALQKCLAENKGDKDKCVREVQSFQAACGAASPKSG